MMTTAKKQIYSVGIYCRLSKDDGTDTESASISTQKSILTDYVLQKGWRLFDTYVDDGYSGTNFERPDFKRMIQDVKKGLIDCIITKDLSRLGRNYLDCGLYLEVFFPEHNVRYISVNDGVDTLNKSAMDITPFRNILNEMYAADVSVKVRSAYKARFHQGKYMGTSAPYGYKKDPTDKNHLLIDETVAPVVRKIFELALEGNGIVKIRQYLNSQNILRPAAYAMEKGYTGYERYFSEQPENRYLWSNNSVRSILRSPIYAGHLTGYKRPAISMKSKKRPSRLPEDWETVSNTHEGFVTQQEFETVQKLMTSRRNEKSKHGYENIFSGIVKCADCGYALRTMSANRRKRPELIDCVQYVCNNYGTNGVTACSAHRIEARDLFNAVLKDINFYAGIAINDEKAVKAIQQRLCTVDAKTAKAYERERARLMKRQVELDKLFAALYEDKVMDRISLHNYELMTAGYEKEQAEVSNRLEEINAELAAKGYGDRSAIDFISLIRSYQGITELTASIVNALIDRITVSEREEKEDGSIEQHIKIYYKFVGVLNEFSIPSAKRSCYINDKACAKCGTMFSPGSNVAKYCPSCAKEVIRARNREIKARNRITP